MLLSDREEGNGRRAAAARGTQAADERLRDAGVPEVSAQGVDHLPPDQQGDVDDPDAEASPSAADLSTSLNAPPIHRDSKTVIVFALGGKSLTRDPFRLEPS